LFQQGSLDHSFISELIGKRSFTVGSLQKQIFNDSSVSPCQQIIQIREFLVECVVFFRPDEHNVCRQTGRTVNLSRELPDSVVRTDFFAVRYSERK